MTEESDPRSIVWAWSSTIPIVDPLFSSPPPLPPKLRRRRAGSQCVDPLYTQWRGTRIRVLNCTWHRGFRSITGGRRSRRVLALRPDCSEEHQCTGWWDRGFAESKANPGGWGRGLSSGVDPPRYWRNRADTTREIKDTTDIRRSGSGRWVLESSWSKVSTQTFFWIASFCSGGFVYLYCTPCPWFCFCSESLGNGTWFPIPPFPFCPNGLVLDLLFLSVWLNGGIENGRPTRSVGIPF